MKRFLILLILFPLTTFSQSKDTIETRRMTIGPIFSPDYCYRTLKPDASYEWVADSRDSIEIPKFGFTTGLSMLFHFKKRFTFETGLQYSDKGEKTKSNSLWIPPSGQPDPSIPTKNTFIYHYNYLDVPVKFNYYFRANRWKFFVSGGLSMNLFLFQKTTSILEYSDGHTTSTISTGDGLSRLNGVVLAGFGVDYTLTNRMMIRVEPTYRQSITPIVNSPVKSFSYSVGVNTGLYFKL